MSDPIQCDPPGGGSGAEIDRRHSLAFNALSRAMPAGTFVRLSVRMKLTGAALEASGLAEVMAERDRAVTDLAHSRCRHHDGPCSDIVVANETLGEEVGRLRAENARLALASQRGAPRRVLVTERDAIQRLRRMRERLAAGIREERS